MTHNPDFGTPDWPPEERLRVIAACVRAYSAWNISSDERRWALELAGHLADSSPEFLNKHEGLIKDFIMAKDKEKP